ncbi:hypothetical protein [Streptomyces sp. t39]|uniref:hypothetical protein n=1 Tax=Streptomyces sp. t39 TaxID=1828156 RepID=UPI0011CEAA29|nr:hypothetical protein [Streptomyces sp. t39]TXS39700.1 hypothetical protein EAO77_36145 [Streptomyces sp. t39]
MKIFGREPVLLLAFVAVALKLSSAYGLDVSAEQQGAIMAVLSLVVAVVTAVVLKTGAVAAALVNLAQGVLALFLAFGLEMTAETQVLWMAGVESAVALFLRRDVTAPVAATRLEQSSPVKPQAQA